MNITTNTVITGDLNCNMMKDGTNAVKTLCDDFNLTNVITKPTCFKTTPPTLLDVILVNKPDIVKSSEVTPCPLSDFHHFVTAVLDVKLQKVGRRQVTYRSYKYFDTDLFNRDLERAPFHVSECLEADDQCHFITKLFGQVLEEHAPLKTKTITTKQCAYMNSNWRKAIFRKHQMYNRYWKCRSQKNWHAYRKQRNLCEKLKRSSIRNYMNEKCTNSSREPREFWKMISPYMADKSKSSQNFLLLEEGTLINDPREIAQVFNNKFTTIAANIGKDSPYNNDVTNHPSFELIDNHVDTANVTEFDFKHTDVSSVNKILSNLGINKATGYDGIPPKALKCSSQTMSPILCNAINNMVDQCSFPQPLKKAQVSPIYKAKSRLTWTNFRPVSVLTCISKIFETTMSKQMSPHLGSIFSKHLSAYRENRGCHSVLLHATEIWKQALDSKFYVGIIMTDLSKAFDCLPHNLLVEKFKHYKFSNKAVKLLESYLCERTQRVNIQGITSDWATLTKGVPQGSVVGPQCFNVYINDLLLLLAEHDIVPYNYADDTSFSVTGRTPDEVVQKIKNAMTLLVRWFEDNLMKVNIDKFQFLMLCPNRDGNSQTHYVQIGNITLKSQEGAKLLGIYVDTNLSYNVHIQQKCKKANAKLQALKRLSNFLTTECKLVVLRSFIVSQFLYCAALFHFTGKYFKEKMESSCFHFVTRTGGLGQLVAL
jgi:hypothetical protein